MAEQKPSLRDTIQGTDSVVHQTFNDLQDLGEIIDHTKETTESISRRLNILIRHRLEFENQVRNAIAEAVQKEVAPIKRQLEELLLEKPQVVYIKFKLPGFLNWFLKPFHIFKK